jgi:HSP20 family molecular chaperone IbpA
MARNVTEVTAPESQAQTLPTRGGRSETALRPPVDIYEDGEGITLEADMPGVSKERLNVRVDGDTLLLEGKVQFELPQSAEALYADVRSTVYRRSFVLSRELETASIQATLKDGVLTVKIPKRAELRPRRIEVRAG